MADQTIVCRDCNKEFIFTEGEQAFYAERNLSAPQRCKDCRQNRKSMRGGNGGSRQMYDAVCAQCSAQCQVPFEPRGDKPVLCRECFMASKGSR